MIDNQRRPLAWAAGAALLAGVAGFGLARCTSDAPTASDDGRHEAPAAAKADEPIPATLAMTPQAIAGAVIATETVTAGGLASEIVAQATVASAPNGEVIVTARAGGAVTRVLKRLGDPVRAGEPLAIVEGRDAAQLVSDRTVGEARAALARKALARERYLYDQKVSARVDLERAQAEEVAAAAEARRAHVAAGAARVTGDGRGVIVASPISGRVTSGNVSLGAFVQPETELFRVADPRRVQLEAAVGPRDAQRLAPGDPATVDLPDGGTMEARVRAVTPTLSGETRAATAVLDVIGSLQPGLAVQVRLRPRRGAQSQAIVVPEGAVQTLDGRDVVLVRTSQGFRAVPVTLGQRSAGRVEIVSGLRPGQRIATTNAFLLKAELAKGSGEEE